MIQEVKEKAVVPGDADMIAWGTVLSTVLTCYLIVHHPTSLISFLFRCGITFMIQILLCLCQTISFLVVNHLQKNLK